jgi:hypothetical protein
MVIFEKSSLKISRKMETTKINENKKEILFQ